MTLNDEGFRHSFFTGTSGRSKKYRPNSHCHGFMLKSLKWNKEVIVKSIYDEEHVKDVCWMVLSINNESETYQNLATILDRISDIQAVSSYENFSDFKSFTAIDVDALCLEERLPELKKLQFRHTGIFSGYADFMTKNDIWMEAMRYFSNDNPK